LRPVRVAARVDLDLEPVAVGTLADHLLDPLVIPFQEERMTMEETKQSGIGL